MGVLDRMSASDAGGPGSIPGRAAGASGFQSGWFGEGLLPCNLVLLFALFELERYGVWTRINLPGENSAGLILAGLNS